VALAAKQLCDSRGMTGKPDCAIDNRAPSAYPEKIDRFMKKNWRMTFR
jgi:hypothetical protein